MRLLAGAGVLMACRRPVAARVEYRRAIHLIGKENFRGDRLEGADCPRLIGGGTSLLTAVTLVYGAYIGYYPAAALLEASRYDHS
jgi:hypothetical protein